MGEKINLIKRINENPINYTLLKLIHHELGNGLAVIMGYRTLLQRAITAQAQEKFPPRGEIWQNRNEQWLGYLQAIQDRETLLNSFLTQLRALSPATTYEHFCQEFMRKDLIVILKSIIQRLEPLYPDYPLQVHLPEQPLFIMCDSFWIKVILEHIFRHTITAHTVPTSIYISLDISNHNAYLLREARLALHIKRNLPNSLSQSTEVTETWSEALSQSDREICSAMCNEILQEHGGRIWRKWEGEQEETVFLTLPLAE